MLCTKSIFTKSTKRPHSTQPVPVSSSNNKRRKATCISVLKETPPDAPTQRQQQQQQQQEDNPDSVSRSSSPTYNVSPSDLIDEDDEEDDIPKRTQISDFSVECLHRIFAFCANPRDLCTISTVCRKWHEIVCDPWMVSGNLTMRERGLFGCRRYQHEYL